MHRRFTLHAMAPASITVRRQVVNHHSYYFNNDDSTPDHRKTTASTPPSAAAAVVTTSAATNYGYLSTITEYSNETYETCSNQSSNLNLKNRPQGGNSAATLYPRHSASSNSTATSLTNQNATVISADDIRTVVHAATTATAVVVSCEQQLLSGHLKSQHSDDMKAASVDSSVTTVKKLSSPGVDDQQDVFDHLDDSKVTLRRKGRAVKDAADSSAAGHQDDHHHYDVGAPTHEYQQLVNRKVNSWLRVCSNEENRERQLQQLTKSDISVYDITVNEEGQLNQLLTSSASVTDKLFEKFCMIANDEIMNEADFSVTSSSMLIASNPPRPLVATAPAPVPVLKAVTEDLANQSSSSSASFKTSLSQIKDDGGQGHGLQNLT